MVEDILKKDGLSFALLRKLSFRTRLEENLDQPISGLDEETLTEELKNIVAWYDSSDILAGLPIDYRIKSLQAILRKYQRASGESRVERVFNDILGFRTLCDNYEEILRLREAKNISVVDMSNGKTHDETVVLLSHKKPDGHINVKVEFGEGEGKVPLDNIAKRAEEYKPKERVTYKMIKEYIEAKYGFKVHTAYIAEVKRDLGLPMYDAPNAVEELKQPRKHPTAEKVEAIKDALKHFEVI